MRFSTLAEWLAWQETLHPKAIDLGLERVRVVAQRMGLLAPAPVVITVAGTNGKGSCVALLEAILRAAGYRVGAYTSPHLMRYNERVRVDGQEAADADLCASFERIDAARGEVSLSYFEFGTLAALDIFQRARLDVAVLEVGLGGRLDAVNIVDADASILSSVGIDHREWLGDTREQIGREKAGVFRSGRPAVCGDLQPPRSVAEVAGSVGAHLLQLGADFQVEAAGPSWTWRSGADVLEGLPIPALPGEAQLRNAACVLTALRALASRLPVQRAAIEQGLRAVRLTGRFQRIAGPVETVLDVAHNPDSAQTLARLLTAQPCPGRTLAVFAVLADKDLAGILAPLGGVIDAWYLGGLTGPRARRVEALGEDLGRLLPGAVHSQHPTVAEAYAAAAVHAVPGDRIVVFGSFHTVAEVLGRLV